VLVDRMLDMAMRSTRPTSAIIRSTGPPGASIPEIRHRGGQLHADQSPAPGSRRVAILSFTLLVLASQFVFMFGVSAFGVPRRDRT
jgi:hypothetical protein